MEKKISQRVTKFSTLGSGKKMTEKDREILENIDKGRDNEALTEIYKKSLPKIRKYILSNNGTEEEVKDVFQDTIVIFYRKVKTGKFREDVDIDAFLFAVARNLYINYVSRHLKRNVKTTSGDERDRSEDLLQQLIDKEKEKHIENIFNELGAHCAKLLRLNFFNDLSMKEIAQMMGFANENVAKTKSYKCRQRLSLLVKNN
ncbi:MAG TPA: sigma-70 family RNA polymerase sigma factor, partial [Cytophagales bacterium]|nr:sigma-70 family RNA polymerase sigma factor [Cytophagales bacterium]